MATQRLYRMDLNQSVSMSVLITYNKYLSLYYLKSGHHRNNLLNNFKNTTASTFQPSDKFVDIIFLVGFFSSKCMIVYNNKFRNNRVFFWPLFTSPSYIEVSVAGAVPAVENLSRHILTHVCSDVKSLCKLWHF